MDLSSALKVLNFEEHDNLTLADLKQRYRELAKDRHPDITGGGSEEFVQLQAAYVHLRKDIIRNKDSKPVADNPEKSTTSTNKDNGSKNDSKPVVSFETRITPENALKTLSKDEILDKYLKDTKVLQVQLESLSLKQISQKTELNKVLSEVQKLQFEYQTKITALQNELQKEVDRLEGGRLKQMWHNLIINPLTGRNDYEAYQKYVESYNKKRKTLQFDFNDKLVNIYGRTLNQMNQYFDDEEEV